MDTDFVFVGVVMFVFDDLIQMLFVGVVMFLAWLFWVDCGWFSAIHEYYQTIVDFILFSDWFWGMCMHFLVFVCPGVVFEWCSVPGEIVHP